MIVVYVKTIIKELADQGKTDLLVCVANFIAYHDKKDWHGGYSAEAAWMALCAILDVPDDDAFYKIIRGTP
jgi:hypothetical protein